MKILEPSAIVMDAGQRTLSNGAQVPIRIQDTDLCVHMRVGDEVDVDVSCDSAFMLDCMPRVGAALRQKFHWVAPNVTIYVCLDNAGGHGTDDAKNTYTEVLNEFNIEIIWQVPRSPETNMLDLGVWMSIQTAVSKVHIGRRCQHDALALSVEDAWNSYLSANAFRNVYNRLRVVLSCIVEARGDNHLVESKRGKLFRDATIIDITNDNVNEDDSVNNFQDTDIVSDEESISNL